MSNLIVCALEAEASPKRAVEQQRFFKTGKGEYAEGDIFLGVGNPNVRRITKKYRDEPLQEVLPMLADPRHEVRLCALLIMVEQYSRGTREICEKVFQAYRDNVQHVNNWDLVDLSAPGIVGEHAWNTSRTCLASFAKSSHLWEQRIAMVGTLALIRHGEFSETLKLAKRFLTHSHDLMHKAVGWMLREVGKRDRSLLDEFLSTFGSTMPRTALRYAIEHYPEPQRKQWLAATRQAAG